MNVRTRTWLAIGAGLISVLAHVAARAEPPGQDNSFREDVLLARFDSDGDGRLDDRERAAVRAAFGEIDVPMLPARPFDYTRVCFPNHLDVDELQRADNTPEDNPLTNAGAMLGRVLFYDKQLSQNRTISCASCHHQRAGFSDPQRFSVGFAGGRTTRSSMGLTHLRYTNLKGARPGFFWDERAATLEDQVLMPIQDPVEMGMELKQLEARLQELPYYPPLFAAAFGSPETSSRRIAQAIAQFLRSMTTWDSRFDRAAKDAAPGDYSAPFQDFTDQENLGKSLFIDGMDGVVEFGCATCHLPPTFTMPKAFNNGLERTYRDLGLGALGRVANDPFTPSDDGKFKAPSLRNIALTAPYMHDGRFQTLEEVLEHYSAGVQPHENLGLAFQDSAGEQPAPGYRFTQEQKAALVAFLKTLSDPRLASDPRFSDPFLRVSGKQVAE